MKSTFDAVTNRQASPTRPKINNDELSNQTLMVVDDHQENLSLMQSLFESDYQIVTYDNAIEAIDHAQHFQVDLILLDINMPSMHGYEACRQFKAHPETSFTPIIFVTAADNPESEATGLALGAVDYIIKPVNLAILKARVRNHMELVYYRKQLEFLSNVDGLTGLVNRRRLDSILLSHYNLTLRFAQRLTLMMIDIDNFKSYNDQYGHLQGDDCLRKVAQCLQAECRETDTIGRYGGEEFVIVLPDTDVEGALTVATKLLHAVRKLNIESADKESCVTISIGLTVFDGSNDCGEQPTLQALIQLADEQLYEAKRKGKNRVCNTLATAQLKQAVLT